jgi:phospholipid-binding lipoprotein MlaA
MRAVFRHFPSTGTLVLVGCAYLIFCLLGCATPPPASDPDALADYRETNDPLEPTNRVFYKINDALDTAVMAPVARAYRFVTPEPVRNGVHNFLDNLGGPVRLTNDTLQGNPRRAGDTAMRFLINSTIGLAGTFDVAKSLGYPNHDSDFGLTLANWNVPEGPFLFLPILGPSNPRDVAGFGVDIGIDPFTWIGHGTAKTIASWSKTALSAVDTRASLLDTVENIKKTALDPYATFRSLYRQNRTGKLNELRADDRATIPIWWPEAAKAQAEQRRSGQANQ